MTTPAAPARPSHLAASRRGRPGDDPIFALNKEATARRAKGESIVNATLGSLLNDDGTLAILPTAARAVKEVPAGEWAGYAPIAGTDPFLKAVIEDVFRGRTSLSSKATAVATPGGSGALRHAVATFLEPGQALLTTSYYWNPYATIADEQERRVETFSMFSATGALDAAALDRALAAQMKRQGRALLILNDPCQNPTGYSMSREDWAAVTDVLARHADAGALTVLLDAAYSAYGPAGDVSAPLAALEPLVDRLLVLVAWTASKTFTHYGLRVGALVAIVPDAAERAETNAALTYACRGTWSNCNRGGIVAVTRLLTDPVLRPAVDAERATSSPCSATASRPSTPPRTRRASPSRATPGASSRPSSRRTPSAPRRRCARRASTSSRSRGRYGWASARSRRPTLRASSRPRPRRCGDPAGPAVESPAMRRRLLALFALLVVGMPARTSLAKGGKPVVQAPTWTEEDGRTVLHVFAPSPLKAYYAAPSNLAEGKKAELIVILHGHGGTATGMLGYISPVADGRGAAILACEGAGTVKTDTGEGHSWSDPDVQGVLACLDATLAKQPIDPKRVVLVGHSAGGSMSVRTHAARPAAFAGVYTSAAPTVPSGGNKGGRFVVNIGTKDANFGGFPGAVAASEKAVTARVVAVIDLPHELPHVDYSREAVAWLLDSKAPSEVLHVPLVPGDEVRAPPDAPAAKAKGKGFRHILLFEKGGRGAPADAPEKAVVKAAAQAIAAEWKKASDLGELVASKSQDPLSKDLRGLVTGEVLARYGGALVTAMSKLRGGDVSAPVEGDAGWHVVARDPE